MSLGLILIIIPVIFLLGGFSGRFGDCGYGYGHGGIGVIGIILIILVALVLMGRRPRSGLARQRAIRQPTSKGMAAPTAALIDKRRTQSFG